MSSSSSISDTFLVSRVEEIIEDSSKKAVVVAASAENLAQERLWNLDFPVLQLERSVERLVALQERVEESKKTVLERRAQLGRALAEGRAWLDVMPRMIRRKKAELLLLHGLVATNEMERSNVTVTSSTSSSDTLFVSKVAEILAESSRQADADALSGQLFVKQDYDGLDTAVKTLEWSAEDVMNMKVQVEESKKEFGRSRAALRHAVIEGGDQVDKMLHILQKKKADKEALQGLAKKN